MKTVVIMLVALYFCVHYRYPRFDPLGIFPDIGIPSSPVAATPEPEQLTPEEVTRISVERMNAVHQFPTRTDEAQFGGYVRVYYLGKGVSIIHNLRPTDSHGSEGAAVEQLQRLPVYRYHIVVRVSPRYRLVLREGEPHWPTITCSDPTVPITKPSVKRFILGRCGYLPANPEGEAEYERFYARYRK